MEFLKGKAGTTTDDPVKAYILYGSWSTSTLKHYNSGVAKLITFAKTFGIDREALLPIRPEYLYQFVLWAGPKIPGDNVEAERTSIKSTTIRTYLSGIKAWHLYHDCLYPHDATPRVELLLKTAMKLDLVGGQKIPKNPVLVNHLFVLLEKLTGGNLEDQTIYTVALVAFWGMARLGELLKSHNAPDQVRVKDVIWDPMGEYASIRIRAAKTAAVGEIQEIHLRRQHSLLDPVSALRRLISCTRATKDEDLFSYPVSGRETRRTMTKARAQILLKQVWVKSTKSELTGHSFRVGGASLRWNLGVDLDSIVTIGRWRSKAYQLYLRKYSDKEMEETRQLLEHLRTTQ